MYSINIEIDRLKALDEAFAPGRVCRFGEQNLPDLDASFRSKVANLRELACHMQDLRADRCGATESSKAPAIPQLTVSAAYILLTRPDVLRIYLALQTKHLF